ncbi:hypothetical protein ACHQM5_002149 [Ranunculus cassubicifolius]
MRKEDSGVKVKQQLEEDDIPLQCKKWVEALSEGVVGPEIETKCLQGLKVVRAEKGFFLCTFVVPKTLSDKDGNWHTGAIAILLDDLAATAVASLEGKIKLSVDFDISFLSSVKIEEEVEIEAKVLSHKGKLTSVSKLCLLSAEDRVRSSAFLHR